MKSNVTSFAAALVVLSCVACAGRPAQTPRALDASKPHLRVMTYNVNYGLAGDQSVLDAIRDAKCDIVFLQETTPAWESALRAKFGAHYAHIEFRHGAGAGGMALLSKYRITESRIIQPPKGGWFFGWKTVLATPLGRVQAINVHLRPKVSDSGSYVSGYFTTHDIRYRQLRHYYGKLSPKLPTLIVGDFNARAGEKALKFLASKGMTNAKHAFQPNKPTWRWKLSVGSLSYDFDHIVHDDKLTAVNAWVVRQGRSDHLPVIAVFQRASDARGR